jgi:hypothetical protein
VKCGGTDERAERGKVIVVHKSIAKSVVTISVCSDRIIAVTLKAEPVTVLILQLYIPTSEYEMTKWESCIIQMKKCFKRMEKPTQTPLYGGLEECGWK